MKIQEVELRHISLPLKDPFETSFGVEKDREAIIIRVHSGGKDGWGECVAMSFPGYSYETTGTAWEILSNFFIPPLFDDELIGVQDYRSRIRHYRGHPMARAGLEMALWDLEGRIHGKSLWQLFGSSGGDVQVGVSIGIQEEIEALLKAVERYQKAGYRRIKIKIKPGMDHEITRAVRKAFPAMDLQVDANSAYRLESSQVFKAMDDLSLVLIEQPLAEDDLIDHATLQSKLDTALCLDESIHKLEHVRQALQIDACRIVNIKQARVGGLTEAIAIHDYCHKREVPVWCGGMLETGIGRAANLALASLPGFLLPGDISATDRYYERDITQQRFELTEESRIKVPDGPGLGVDVDMKFLEMITMRAETFSD